MTAPLMVHLLWLRVFSLYALCAIVFLAICLGRLPLSPLHCLAAVDHHRGSDDEGSRIRTQPQDGCGDLLRLAGPPDWLHRRSALELSLLPLRSAPAEAIHHRRVDDPGAHDVDADVRLRVLEGRRPGQADHAVLGGDVCGPLEAFDPGTRGGVHD